MSETSDLSRFDGEIWAIGVLIDGKEEAVFLPTPIPVPVGQSVHCWPEIRRKRPPLTTGQDGE